MCGTKYLLFSSAKDTLPPKVIPRERKGCADEGDYTPQPFAKDASKSSRVEGEYPPADFATVRRRFIRGKGGDNALGI